MKISRAYSPIPSTHLSAVFSISGNCHSNHFCYPSGRGNRLFEGKMYGLIGHNGSGKSTLIKLLAKQQPLSSGDNQPLDAWSNREFAKRVAYLPQHLPQATNYHGYFYAELVRYKLKCHCISWGKLEPDPCFNFGNAKNNVATVADFGRFGG